MAPTIEIFDKLNERFSKLTQPDDFDDIGYVLGGGIDPPRLFGLYLYNLVKESKRISNIVNIGTARGYSAVCCARGLIDSDREGTVHTIDIIPHDEPRNWHNPDGHPPDDPIRNEKLSTKELVGRFIDLESDEIDVNFITGDSNEVLRNWDAGGVDLVFHDGLHKHQQVKNDMKYTNEFGENRPVHVFDDCHIFSKDWEFRPFDNRFFYKLDYVRGIRRVLEKTRQFSIAKKQYPGVTQAVWGEYESNDIKMEIIIDEAAWQPITKLEYEESR